MKKKIVLIILTCISLNFVSCGTKTDTIDFNNKNLATQFENDLFAFSLNSEQLYSSKTFKDNLTKFLDTKTKTEQEKFLEYYINGLAIDQEDLKSKLGLLGFELEKMLEKYNFVEVSSENIKKAKVTDEFATIKGFVKEIESKGFSLYKNKETGYYELVMKMQPLIDSYGNYMSESYKAYLTFIDNQYTAPILKDKKVDVNSVAKKIIDIEKGLALDIKNGYKHIDKWMSLYSYYYDSLLGLSHDDFKSGEYYKSDIIKSYKEIAKTYENTELATNLNKIIAILEENKNISNTEVGLKLEEVVNSKYKANNNEIQNKIDAKNNSINTAIDSLKNPVKEEAPKEETPKEEAPKEAPATTSK